VEDWMVDVANSRGATVVRRTENVSVLLPSREEFSDEELITAISLPQCMDRPQMLRLAAQLISRGEVSVETLCHLGRRERVGTVLAALALGALRVDPSHRLWAEIRRCFDNGVQPRDAVLHWTRLAEPIPGPNGLCGSDWRLVA